MTKTAHLVLDPVDPSRIRFRASTDRGQEYALDSREGAVDPSPIDVLIAALGACTGMDVITILRKKRLVVTAYAIELVGERRDEHPRAFVRIAAVHRFRGRGLPRADVEEALRLSETKYCSVHATLAPGVELSSRIEIEEESENAVAG